MLFHLFLPAQGYVSWQNVITMRPTQCVSFETLLGPSLELRVSSLCRCGNLCRFHFHIWEYISEILRDFVPHHAFFIINTIYFNSLFIVLSDHVFLLYFTACVRQTLLRPIIQYWRFFYFVRSLMLGPETIKCFVTSYMDSYLYSSGPRFVCTILP